MIVLMTMMLTITNTRVIFNQIVLNTFIAVNMCYKICLYMSN